jgi:hypothetical protein
MTHNGPMLCAGEESHHRISKRSTMFKHNPIFNRTTNTELELSICYGWVRGAAQSRADFSMLSFRTNQKTASARPTATVVRGANARGVPLQKGGLRKLRVSRVIRG